MLKFTHDICQWSKPSAVSGAVNYGHSSSMQIREDADLFDFVRCVMEEIVIVIGLPRVFLSLNHFIEMEFTSRQLLVLLSFFLSRFLLPYFLQYNFFIPFS